jgi:hypothetical protein
MFFQTPLPNAGAPISGPVPGAAPPAQPMAPPPNLAALLALLQRAGGPAAVGQFGAPAGALQAPPFGAAAASGTAPSPVLAAAQRQDQLSQLFKLLKSFVPPQALESGLDAGGASAEPNTGGARRGMRQP